MRSVWRFLRQWWWAFLAVAGGLTILIWRILMARSGAQLDPEIVPGPTFADRARDEVERVRLEGEVEKAKVTAQADAQRAELDRIEEVGRSDPRAARRQLSDFLTRSL